jgi:hypothetical protein
MGKLLILLAMIVVTVILLGLWGLFLDRQKQRTTLGLQQKQKKVEELEDRQAHQTATLQEIHDLAETEITLGEGADVSMWQVVQGLATEALKEEDKP